MEYRGSYEQANARQSYWQSNPYSDFYNGNPRNEPDFSWMSNDVQNPPQPTYPYPPYQPTYQHPYQSTYQQPYHPPFQPTYREPYHSPYQSPDFQIPNFRQPLPCNSPQPNGDLAELKVLMQQLLASQIAFQEDMNASLIQPAVTENREEHSITRSSNILTDRVITSVLENTTVLDRVQSYPVECLLFQPESAKLDRATCRANHTRSSIIPIDRVNHSAPPNTEFSTSRTKTKEPEAKIVIRLPFPNRHRKATVEHQVDILEATLNSEKLTRKQDDNVSETLMCLDSPIDEVDDHSAVVDALEAALYGTELNREHGETVSEVVHTSKAIEVRNSELQSQAIEVTTLKLELPPSDLNIYLINDNEDCFVINNIVLSKPHPLEKGHYFYIQGQGKLQSTMQKVVEEGVRPEKNGTRRGTKRCWDPGGCFDEVRIGPWAWQRDAGNRFGGANGRGTQDDYDDPGDERVTMQSVH